MDNLIYEPPEDRRYWAIKVDGGRSYKKFMDGGFIAIKHLNKYYKDETDTTYPFTLNETEIKSILGAKSKDEEEAKKYSPNLYGQINIFINEVSIGDWIITKKDSHIRVGRVLSHPYLVPEGEQNPDLKTHLLQREIEWGPELDISKLAKDIILSLTAPMTCFNIDKHAEAILHTLYPYFKMNDELYLSINITKNDEVKNFYITQVFKYIDELEFISKIESYEDLSHEKLKELYSEYIRNGDFSLTSKASFSSPGELWIKLAFEQLDKNKRFFYAILAYTMLFGGGYTNFDGVLDVESRRMIVKALVSRIDRDAVIESRNKLQLEMPNHDTKAIESDENDDETVISYEI